MDTKRLDDKEQAENEGMDKVLRELKNGDKYQHLFGSVVERHTEHFFALLTSA